MIFSCGKSYQLALAEREGWHKHFCLLPHSTGIDGQGYKVCAWLSFVERQGIWHEGNPYESGWWTYKYRQLAE